MGRLNQYTNEARLALTYAREEARQLRHRLIGTEHLLLGVLSVNDPLIGNILAFFGINPLRLRQALEFIVGRGNKAIISEPSLSVPTRSALAYAEQEAGAMGAELVGIEHLLLGLLSERENSSGVTIGVLESFGIALEPVRQHIMELLGSDREQINAATEYQNRYNMTPTLNLVSRDLTMAAMAGALDPMVGREIELERTMQILARRTKNNPALIGQAGVGKTAIAEGLALRIVEGEVPETLQNRRVVALDVGLLTVGTKFRGDFEERLQNIMQEIIFARDIIVVIDELHTLVTAGVAEGSLDAANLFKPMLARGEFQCIGATTFENYQKTIEADPALERRFQPVQVPETSAQETLEILRTLRPRYADFHQVTITDEALVAAVQMSSRYIQNRAQPDKALDLMDEAAARVCVQRTVPPEVMSQLREKTAAARKAKDEAIEKEDFASALRLRKDEQVLYDELWQAEQDQATQREMTRATVGPEQIAEVVAVWTGIPTIQLTTTESEHLLHLEDELHERVIGQHAAVQAVARAVRRSRTNIGDRRRPIGSFLFAGPTGVGKTELARALASALFGDENAMIRLDMSEFMESHLVSRLIGSPPGYVGYEQGGQLTEAVRRRPYSVVLFDEIEKAHPKVFDLLLQILDDGILTNAQGQSVDFTHTIIIITSNAGTAHQLPGSMAFARTQSSQHAQIMPAVKDLFKPELLNRIDEIIVFHALEPTHLHEIVNLMIAQTQRKLAARAIRLEVTPAARHALVENGYDPAYGARPLRRTVQRMLEDLLAEAILQGAFTAGDTVVSDIVAGQLVVRTWVPAASHVLPVKVA